MVGYIKSLGSLRLGCRLKASYACTRCNGQNLCANGLLLGACKMLCALISVSPVSPVSLAAKGSGVIAVFCLVFVIFCLCFLVALVWLLWCFLFPSLPACLRSFTDWCLVQKQQPASKKKALEHQVAIARYYGDFRKNSALGDDHAATQDSMRAGLCNPCEYPRVKVSDCVHCCCMGNIKGVHGKGDRAEKAEAKVLARTSKVSSNP